MSEIIAKLAAQCRIRARKARGAERVYCQAGMDHEDSGRPELAQDCFWAADGAAKAARNLVYQAEILEALGRPMEPGIRSMKDIQSDAMAAAAARMFGRTTA